MDLKSTRRNVCKEGKVTVHFNNHENILAGSSKFTYNAYNCSYKVANITKA